MLKPMVFYSLALTLLLLAGAVSADSTVLKPPEVLAYHGSMRFVERQGDSFNCNGTYFDGTVTIEKIEPLNETAAWVYVDITASEVLYRPDACSDTINLSIPTKIVVRDYRLQLKYLVDTVRNYAWVNGEFIGFFPFYIFPKLSYSNASKYTYIYIEEELKLVSEEGKPLPNVIRLPDNTTLPTLTLMNKYISILFVYHYPVFILGYVPLGNNSYLKVRLWIDGSWLPYLKSIDDYPKSVTFIDYKKLALIIATISVIIVLVIVFIKRRRK